MKKKAKNASYLHTITLISIITTGCATTSPENNPAVPHSSDRLEALSKILPDWAIEESARESSASDKTTIKLGDEHTLEITGDLLDEPFRQEEGDFWYFAVDYGGEEGYLDCYILSNRGEPIHALQDSLDYAIQQWLPEESTVDHTIATAAQVNTDARLPTVLLDYIYYFDVDTDNTTIARSYGEAAYQKSHVLVCTNDVFGYRKTFQRIFGHMVNTWDINDDALIPYYHETVEIKINDATSGFAVIDLYRDDEGDTRAVSVNSTLLRPDVETVLMDEGSEVSWSTPDGKLLSAYHSHTENGELTANLQLQRIDDGSWIASGSYQDKDVEFDLGADSSPLSVLGRYQFLQKMASSSASDTQTFPLWEPSADPSSILDATVSLDSAGASERSGTLQMGPLKFDMFVDGTGSVPEMSANMGGNSMQMNRVRKTGNVE